MSSTVPTQRRSWLRFGIRTILVLMVLVSVPLAWKMTRVRAHRSAVGQIANAWGFVVYDFHDAASAKSIADPDHNTQRNSRPNWVRTLFGDDLFYDVVVVNLGQGHWSDLSILENFPAVETLHFQAYAVSDDSLKHLQKCKRLRRIDINTLGIRIPPGYSGKTLHDEDEAQKLRDALPDCEIAVGAWEE